MNGFPQGRSDIAPANAAAMTISSPALVEASTAVDTSTRVLLPNTLIALASLAVDIYAVDLFGSATNADQMISGRCAGNYACALRNAISCHCPPAVVYAIAYAESSVARDRDLGSDYIVLAHIVSLLLKASLAKWERDGGQDRGR